MTRLRKPPYVHEYRDRHGKVRIYLRMPGRVRVALPGPLYSPAFWTAYHAALEDNASASAIDCTGAGAERIKPGSVSALIAAYYASAAFTSLAPSTQIAYRNMIEPFRKEHGDKPVAGLKAKHIDAILGEVAKRSKSQAYNLRKRLRTLGALAVSWGYRDDNPVLSAQRIKHKEKGFRPWTEDDIKKFRKRWAGGTPQRIAFEILLNTGLRRSDAVKLGRQHRDGNRHVVSLKKSGETITVYIPILPRLEEQLATLSGTCLTYIQTARGVARSEKAFTNWIGEAADAAGLPPNSSPHGLRKACCRRLAEGGCTSAEISAITGQSIAVIERYIKDYSRENAAVKAMASIKDDYDENEAQTKTG